MKTIRWNTINIQWNVNEDQDKCKIEIKSKRRIIIKLEWKNNKDEDKGEDNIIKIKRLP